jgi:hypothetical protein
MMTAPSAVMNALTEAGLSVTLLPPDGLRATPVAALTGELAALIRANKTQLLEYLQAVNDANEIAGIPVIELWTDPLDAPMTSGEVATFTTRMLLFMVRGIGAAQAESLADKLKRCDREHDNRHVCLECSYLRNGRNCIMYRLAGLCSPEVACLTARLQRCRAFVPAVTALPVNSQTATRDGHD